MVRLHLPSIKRAHENHKAVLENQWRFEPQILEKDKNRQFQHKFVITGSLVCLNCNLRPRGAFWIHLQFHQSTKYWIIKTTCEIYNCILQPKPEADLSFKIWEQPCLPSVLQIHGQCLLHSCCDAERTLRVGFGFLPMSDHREYPVEQFIY